MTCFSVDLVALVTDGVTVHFPQRMSMKHSLTCCVLLGAALAQTASATEIPNGLLTLTGDRSIVLHWEPNSEPNIAGYRVYYSTNSVGPFTLLTPTLLTAPGYCDLATLRVVNGKTNFYYVTAVNSGNVESLPTATLSATPHPFANDDEFLDYVQRTSFAYFWYRANPANGLVPDRSANGSACSIAAVGFGLTAIGIAVDHGWITRTQAATRVLTTLNTFLNGPQGPATFGTIGYKGWFYHFLDMNTALRSPNSELSSIDTALLLGGILYAKQYFNEANPNETAIRATADAIFNRVDWNWMAQGTNVVSMGWFPGAGFLSANWIGYNEGMIIYCLGMGAATNPLPVSSWSRWTSGYTWGTYYGQTYVSFPPLFGHEYSHCWIDFRHISDAYMNSHNTTYFENSRRAALSQVTYCSTGPKTGYSSEVWGLTACDGPPPVGYSARGIPPALDDGTIAPTAAGGAIPFAPEYSLPTLRAFYTRFRLNIWTAYGFRDAFNIGAGWYASDVLGIDQGPIVIMIENYRNQRVWQLFMQSEEVQRGLQRAGFVPLPFMALSLQPTQAAYNLSWTATAGRSYQVEHSPELATWAAAPGFVQATNTGTFTWLDAETNATQRFYRVFQLGTP